MAYVWKFFSAFHYIPATRQKKCKRTSSKIEIKSYKNFHQKDKLAAAIKIPKSH